MRPLLLLLLLSLAACGFHPLQSREYQSSLAVGLNTVRIEVDEFRLDQLAESHSHLGQMLETEIREGVNPSLQPAEKFYLLRISLSERDIPLFINPDGTSSRGDIEYDSSYTLSRIADGKLIQGGTISRVSSYNTSQNQDYASYVSEEDAKNRGVLELAEAYKLRLANLLPRLNGLVIPPEDQPKAPKTAPNGEPLPSPAATGLGASYEAR